MVKLVGTGGNQVPTNNMLGNMAFQNKEGVAIDLLGLAAGTAAAPSLIPSGDPNTGVWFPAADTIAASTDGNERIRIDSAGDISLRFSANQTRTISFFNLTNSVTYGRIRYTDTSGIFDIANANAFPLTLSTNATERMRITSTGLVGIGTSSPVARLHVYGTTSATQQVRVDGTDTTSLFSLCYNGSQVGFLQNYTNTEINFGTSVSAPIMFYTNNTEKMRLGANGFLGIGIASAAAPLHVVSTSTPQMRAAFDASNYTDVRYDGFNTVGGAQVFRTGGNERMRVDTAGNVGIGISSPLSILHIQQTSAPEVRLQNGTSASTGRFGFYSSTLLDGSIEMVPQTAILTINSGRSAGWGGSISFVTDTTEKMRINSAGNIFIGGTSTVSPLTLNKAVYLQSSTDNDIIGYNLFINDGSNNRRAAMFLDDANGLFGWDVTASSGVPAYVWRTATTERMRVTEAGNLGIGTTTPTANTGYTSVHVNNNTNGGILEVSNASTVRGWFGVDATGAWLRSVTNHSLYFSTNNTERMRIDSAGNVIVNTAAIATTATNGFLYIPGCAGTPTGVPTAQTGRVPLVVDTTNNKLYFYSGGAWRDAGP